MLVYQYEVHTVYLIYNIRNIHICVCVCVLLPVWCWDCRVLGSQRLRAVSLQDWEWAWSERNSGSPPPYTPYWHLYREREREGGREKENTLCVCSYRCNCKCVCMYKSVCVCLRTVTLHWVFSDSLACVTALCSVQLTGLSVALLVSKQLLWSHSVMGQTWETHTHNDDEFWTVIRRFWLVPCISGDSRVAEHPKLIWMGLFEFVSIATACLHGGHSTVNMSTNYLIAMWKQLVLMHYNLLLCIQNTLGGGGGKCSCTKIRSKPLKVCQAEQTFSGGIYLHFNFFKLFSYFHTNIINSIIKQQNKNVKTADYLFLSEFTTDPREVCVCVKEILYDLRSVERSGLVSLSLSLEQEEDDDDGSMRRPLGENFECLRESFLMGLILSSGRPCQWHFITRCKCRPIPTSVTENTSTIHSTTHSFYNPHTHTPLQPEEWIPNMAEDAVKVLSGLVCGV